MSTLYPAQQPFTFDNDAFGLGNPADPFDPVLDRPRLSKQQQIFDDFMVQADRLVTLSEIERATGIPQASASARYRESKLPKERRHRAGAPRGTWEYRVWR